MYGRSILEKMLPLLVWFSRLRNSQKKVELAATVKQHPEDKICLTCGNFPTCHKLGCRECVNHSWWVKKTENIIY